MDEALLTTSFYQLKRQSAAGCDGVTWQAYQQALTWNINTLVHKLREGRYRPKPARRVFIPKEDGSQRPLSIICLEDKIVQQAVVTILNQIYETDFLGFSYGFRPGRGQHDALDALTAAIKRNRVNWVLDLDISKFFDTIEHGRCGAIPGSRSRANATIWAAITSGENQAAAVWLAGRETSAPQQRAMQQFRLSGV